MTLTGHLTSLESSGLIRLAAHEPELEYLFKHALVQDAVYESLLRQDRRHLHEAVGHTLEALYTDRLDEIQAVLAYHYERAEAWSQTVVYARAAASHAKTHYANSEALLYYDLALRAIHHLQNGAATDTNQQTYLQQQFDILSERHGVATLVGLFDQSRANLEAMVDLARQLDDDSRLADALIGLGYFSLNTGARDPGPPLEEALAIKRLLGDLPGLADCLNTIGTHYTSVARVERGMVALEEAHDLYQSLGNRDGLARSEWNIGTIAYELLGDYDRALNCLSRSIQLTRESGNRALECGGLLMTGAVYARIGAYEDANTYLGQALTFARQIGDRPAEGWALLYLSWPSLDRGDFELSQTQAEQAFKIARELGVGNLAWYALQSLARISLVAAQPEKAWGYASEAYEASRGISVWVEVVIRSQSLLARIAALLGRRDEADQLAREALNRLEKIGGQGVSQVQSAYFNCYLALRDSDEPQARLALNRAHEIVIRYADSIADPERREWFLLNVRDNQEILQAWS